MADLYDIIFPFVENCVMQKKKYGNSSAAGCIKAGNDLTMPGSQKDVETIVRAVREKEGKSDYLLTLRELQACAKRVLKVVMNCSR